MMDLQVDSYSHNKGNHKFQIPKIGMRAIKLFLGEKVRLPALIWISILTFMGIGRIRIHGYGNFLKNPIRGYVYYLFKKIK
jgi:hypothetical protein